MIQLVRHLAEYISLRIVAWVVGVLPYQAALFFAWTNAALTFLILRPRMREAESRIRQVFGNKYSSREVTRIAWQSWLNTVLGGMEVIRLSKMTPAWMQKYFEYKHTTDTIKAYLDKTKRGAVIACAHTGSWGLASVAAQTGGIPIFVFTARQRNPFTDAYLNKLRGSTGIKGVRRGAGVEGGMQIVRNLKEGQVLAILPDGRVPREAVSVPFLGGLANIGEGMGGFARHADVPIFPCIITRIGWSHHKVEVYDPIWPDQGLPRREDITRMTIAVMKIVEDAIRRDPGQWFWFNRRWILDPVEPSEPRDVSNNPD